MRVPARFLILRLLLISSLAVGPAACKAQQPRSNWAVDCVGRLSIGLPGPVDVATAMPRHFTDNAAVPTYQFPDGQSARFSKFVYGGALTMTAPLDQVQTHAIWQSLKGRTLDVRSSIKKGVIRSPDGSPTVFETLKLGGGGLGWKVADATNVSLVAYPSVVGHALEWQVSAPPHRVATYMKQLEHFVAGVMPRPLLTTPSDAGVCFPYLFVRDIGQEKADRLVAVTYRLKEHPDVSVTLEDASVTGGNRRNGLRGRAAIEISNLFWLHNYLTEKNKDNLLNGSYNKVSLAGQDAVETMFRLLHEDNTEDFGYLVVAEGEVRGRVERPRVKLHIVRQASDATKRGIVPMEKGEFFALARSIAASVQSRDGGR